MSIQQKYKNAAKTFAFFLLGFYILVITHELTHGFIAGEFCQTVRYHWIPSIESGYLASTSYGECSAVVELRRMQRIVEIVGYQLMAFYTAICSFYILVNQKVKF